MRTFNYSKAPSSRDFVREFAPHDKAYDTGISLKANICSLSA